MFILLEIYCISDENKIKIVEEIKNREEDNNSLEASKVVIEIIEKVKRNGDWALTELSEKYDGVKIENFEVSEEEIETAFSVVNEEFVQALLKSKENLYEYHNMQKREGYRIERNDGSYLGQRIIPIERVGVYVPGGSATYPSSVLMNVIPAKVAGVGEIVMVTPPSKYGSINPYLAVAAKVAGVSKIYKIGGAQGIAALAYGTETIKKVDKIVGPGNIYVALAKKFVFGKVDIDMIAGPSEILVIADEKSNAKYIAADLMSQSEHDKLASSILLTTSYELCESVKKEIELQVEGLERKEIILEALKNYGKLVVCRDIEECIDISNEVAPEHLELMVVDPLEFLDKVKNAGSVFLGENTPEPVGDYIGGTNHVLPTNGTARFFSPLGVDSFTKKSSYISYSKRALEEQGSLIVEMANKEGLTAHANSVKVRLV